MKIAHLLGKIAGYVGARFLGAGLGFLSQIVLARLLPQSDVGTVLMGMSAAAFVSLATHGGYALLAFTQLPKLVYHGRPETLRAFHRVVLTDTLIWSLLLFGLLAVTAAVFNFSEAQKVAWLFGCLCSPVSSLMRYNSTIAQANRRMELSYVPDFIIRPGLFLLALLVQTWLGIGGTALEVLVVFTVITYAVTIGQAIYMGPMRLNVLDVGWPRASLTRQVRGRAMSLVIVSGVMLAFADIVTLLSAFLLPAHDVAIVGITMRLAAIAGFVLQAGQAFILPDYTAAVLRRDKMEAHGILMKLNLTTIAIVLAGLIGTAVLGKLVLSLFGADYVQGWHLLMLFMVGQSIRALGGMNQHILSMEGFQLRTAGACIAALTVLALAAIMLCRLYGFVGMGYAVILAELVWLVLLGHLAGRHAGRRGDLWWLARQPK